MLYKPHISKLYERLIFSSTLIFTDGFSSFFCSKFRNLRLLFFKFVLEAHKPKLFSTKFLRNLPLSIRTNP